MPRNANHTERSRRIDVRYAAVLIDADGQECDVFVTELSSGGFRLAVDALLRVGERVRLRVERYGEFPAEIRWILGGQAGGVFLEPVNLSVS